MDRMGRNLQIIYLEIPPERVLGELLRPFAGGRGRGPSGNNLVISEEVYCRYAGGRWQCWSEDENHLFAQAMGKDSLLLLPALCGERYLRRTQDELRCRFEQTRAWRDAYHIVGQDLIAAAYLAYDDLRTGRQVVDFSWDAVLRTDHRELNALLSQGLAENHFHLKGSTQSFPLSWCCMMNFPDHAAAKWGDVVSVNRYPGISRGEEDNVLSHRERLQLAACLRVFLYLAMHDGDMDIREEFERQRRRFCSFAGAGRLVEQTRYLYGSRRDMPDGSVFCLDYAMQTGDEGHYRLLAGERRLMYHWFRRCFGGETSEGEQRIFYLYLLLKSHFRREFIQENQMVGFDNFEIYQKRKDSIWEAFPPYEHESIRMALRAPMDKGNVRSLEARIMPKESPWKLLQSIWKYDRSQWYAKSGSREGFPAHPSWTMKAAPEPFFYVLHFAKAKDDGKMDGFWVMERHHALRKKIRQHAMATAGALCRSEYLRHCVRGIDACASEIGCRPEVFAAGFRFLRDFVPCRQSTWYDESRTKTRLSITYHAGEDFLDLADGLRAIDEAVRFLGMQRGDRLGHALALGIDPHAHYEGKCFQIVQPMQDRLDDLVWMLFRGNELGIRMDPCLRAGMEQHAAILLDEIYPDENDRFSLLDYYESWHLRGDSPLLYRMGRVSLPSGFFQDTCHLCLANRNAEEQRKSPRAVELFFRYHYDARSRRTGNCVRVYDIRAEYVDFIRQLQDRMQSFLAERGIAIECNPSSNVLIGTFRDYALHPMFRFSSSPMGDVSGGTELSISINTDDLGVFDTSLEFEYALVAHALLYDSDGSRLPRNFAAVREYLEKIRRNGWEQAFC